MKTVNSNNNIMMRQLEKVEQWIFDDIKELLIF